MVRGLFFFVSRLSARSIAIVIVEARARRGATLPAMKERFYPKRVVGGRGTDARRYSGAEAGTAGRKPFASVDQNASRGKDGLVDDVRELKQRVRRAQESDDKVAQGLALVRLAEVKLESSSKDGSKLGKEKSQPASSYAFRGAQLLLEAGNIAEGLEGIRLYTRAKHAEGAIASRLSRCFLPHQSCGSSKSERERTLRDIKVFDAFTKVVAKWGNALGGVAIHDQVLKAYTPREPCLGDFLFHDPLAQVSRTDYAYVLYLLEECRRADAFADVARDLDPSHRPRQKYLARALLWKASACVRLLRSARLGAGRKTEEWATGCDEALKEAEVLWQAPGADSGSRVQGLCLRSELSAVEGSAEDALETARLASAAAAEGGGTGGHRAVWAAAAEARALVLLGRFEEAHASLVGAIDGRQGGDVDETSKMEVFHCADSIRVKISVKLKIAALEGQLALGKSRHSLSAGMRQERARLLRQVVRNEKTIGEWGKCLSFAQELSEEAALDPNAWEHLLEVAEASFRLGDWPGLAVASSEAAAVAEASGSAGGRARALLLRATSRLAIEEADLAQADLEECLEVADKGGAGAGTMADEAAAEARGGALCLLSILHGLVSGDEARAAEFQRRAEASSPLAAVAADRGQERRVRERQSARVDELGSAAVLSGMGFGVRGPQGKALVDLLRSRASAEGVEPSPVAERALAGVHLTERKVLGVSARGEPGIGRMGDPEARVFFAVLLGAECCRLMDYHGISLDLAGNRLGNASVKVLCQRLMEIPSSRAAIVDLDLSGNNLSAGSVTEIARCGRIKGHLRRIALKGNRRLLGSQGDVRSLEDLARASPGLRMELSGTALGVGEAERLEKVAGEAPPPRPPHEPPAPPALPPVASGSAETARVQLRRAEERREREREAERKMQWRPLSPPSPRPSPSPVADPPAFVAEMAFSSSLSLSDNADVNASADFLRSDCSSLSSHSDASQDRTRVCSKRKHDEVEDWREALRKLRENHLNRRPRRSGGSGGEEETQSEGQEASLDGVDESVSCTSDSFEPKYATQK